MCVCVCVQPKYGFMHTNWSSSSIFNNCYCTYCSLMLLMLLMLFHWFRKESKLPIHVPLCWTHTMNKRDCWLLFVAHNSKNKRLKTFKNKKKWKKNIWSETSSFLQCTHFTFFQTMLCDGKCVGIFIWFIVSYAIIQLCIVPILLQMPLLLLHCTYVSNFTLDVLACPRAHEMCYKHFKP